MTQLTTIDYEEYIHNKLQDVRYKYNYLTQLMNDNNSNNNGNIIGNNNGNNQNLNNLHLEIIKLELDNLDFKLNEIIFEYDGNYPKEKYKKMEENYLQILSDKLKEVYQDEQKKNKKMIMKTLLPILLQVMMLNNSDNNENSKPEDNI